MDILPIWGTKKFIYQGANVIEYRVLAGENEIFHGRAVKSPATGFIEIELNRICSSYLNSLLLPEYLNNALDEDTVAWGNAYKEFSVQVYDIDTGTWSTEDQWAFVNDYSYENHSIQFGIFSEPINGHSAPGMLLPYSFLTTGDSSTVCYDEMNYMPYITIDPASISFNESGGTATITVVSDSNWSIANEYASYFSQSAGGTGTTQITFTMPVNPSSRGRNMNIRFKATNDKGITTVALSVTQEGAFIYLNVTKGDGIMFDTPGGAWNLEYEANIDEAYYVFSGGQAGYTTGGRLSLEVPSGETDQIFSITFYDAPGGELLDTAYARRLKGVSSYLNFNFLENGEILFWHSSSASSLTIEYSRDSGETWETATSTREGYPITGNTGDIIYVRGTNPTYATSESAFHAFAGSTRCTVGGNIMSLVYGDDFIGKSTIENDYQFGSLFGSTWDFEKTFSGLESAEGLALPATILKPYCYNSMFQGCSSLTAVPSLPATELAEYCYYWMFYRCTSLVNAPALPATTLAENCYYEMFYKCTSLVTAPALPATTLVRYCYHLMFEDCESLVNAPALPATTLARYCYDGMFAYCTSLVNAPALPATTLAKWCYESMFVGCTSLVTAPALPATTLEDGCYRQMFSGCNSLVNAPALPATTIATSCYEDMFHYCASLTTAPELPATGLMLRCYASMFAYCTSLTTAPELSADRLAPECYKYMFQHCTSLNYVKCLATYLGTDSLTDWLNDVSFRGTFVKNASTTWPSGASGIPSMWTVENA